MPLLILKFPLIGALSAMLKLEKPIANIEIKVKLLTSIENILLFLFNFINVYFYMLYYFTLKKTFNKDINIFIVLTF